MHTYPTYHSTPSTLYPDPVCVCAAWVVAWVRALPCRPPTTDEWKERQTSNERTGHHQNHHQTANPPTTTQPLPASPNTTTTTHTSISLFPLLPPTHTNNTHIHHHQPPAACLADPPPPTDAECHSFFLLSILPSNSFIPHRRHRGHCFFHDLPPLKQYTLHYTPTPCDPRSSSLPVLTALSSLQQLEASLRAHSFTSLLQLDAHSSPSERRLFQTSFLFSQLFTVRRSPALSVSHPNDLCQLLYEDSPLVSD